jgi:L-ribulokinase
MAIVAGADFGTLSVRVTLLDSEKGRLGTAMAEYPLHRRRVIHEAMKHSPHPVRERRQLAQRILQGVPLVDDAIQATLHGDFQVLFE